PRLSSVPPNDSKEIADLKTWVKQFAASGAHVTVVSAEGEVLADSLRDTPTTQTAENSTEIVQALEKGSGRAVQKIARGGNLLSYAVKETTGSGKAVAVRLTMPEMTAGRERWTLRVSLWLAVLALVAGAAGIAIFVSRIFADRIERLTAFSH